MFADGPLFDAMRGRKWVLSANAAQVTSGNALANLFALPEKDFIAVVAFAPLQGSVSLVLHLPGPCATPKATALFAFEPRKAESQLRRTVTLKLCWFS